MAKFERYEPRGNVSPAFDDEEFDEEEEEGSRLPLLLVIGLLVVAAFGGVVWLAYTQGVQRGRADAPRMLVSTDGGGNGNGMLRGMKIYQQPAPAEDDEADSVPQGPTQKTDTAADDEAPAPPPAPTPAKVRLAQATPPPAALQPVVKAPPAPAATMRAEPEKPVPAPKVAVADNPPPARIAAPAGPAIATGGVALQIGAYKSEDEADAAREAFVRKHPAAAGYPFAVRQADLGDKGVWYRLRLGAFPDKSAALAFCDKLKADGGTCFLAR